MSIEEIEAMTERWLSGWNIGDGPFNAEVFRDVFASGEGAISVFDNVQGDVISLTSVDAYVDTWTPFMAPLTHWSVALEDLSVVVQGDLAFSTFRLVGTDTRGPDGAPVPFGQYGTHVWQKDRASWRLIHEHLTAYDATRTAQS